MSSFDGSHLVRDGLRVVPILHGHLECAVEVRRQFFAHRPDVVAVEYPNTLRPAIEKAVRRLPHLSVVHYAESDGTDVYTLIEPTDGLVEAVRLALDHDVARAFVDETCAEGIMFRKVKRMGKAAYPHLVKYIDHEELPLGRAAATVLNELTGEQKPLPNVTTRPQVKAEWEAWIQGSRLPTRR